MQSFLTPTDTLKAALCILGTKLAIEGIVATTKSAPIDPDGDVDMTDAFGKVNVRIATPVPDAIHEGATECDPVHTYEYKVWLEHKRVEAMHFWFCIQQCEATDRKHRFFNVDYFVKLYPMYAYYYLS